MKKTIFVFTRVSDQNLKTVIDLLYTLDYENDEERSGILKYITTKLGGRYSPEQILIIDGSEVPTTLRYEGAYWRGITIGRKLI